MQIDENVSVQQKKDIGDLLAKQDLELWTTKEDLFPLK